MSWEEYGIRMLAESERYEDKEFEMRFGAWLHQREVVASDGNKYIYRSFNDFYKPEQRTSEDESTFKRLREVTKRVQELQRGGD